MKLQLYLTDFSDIFQHVLDDSALARLLAAGKSLWLDAAMDEKLCHLFSVARQEDWPLAPFSRLGQGFLPDDVHWLLLSPVNFLLQRDHFLLNQPAPLPLPESEAKILIASLNQHFSAQGLEFSLGDEGHWYLRLPEPPGIQTRLVAEAVGRDIRSFSPQGQSAAKWRSFVNEVQMLLFEHEVNHARESRGELPVNSLWLSGGGRFPVVAQAPGPQLFTDSSLVRGMAVAANMPAEEVPDFETILAHAVEDVIVVSRTGILGPQWSHLSLQALKTRKLSQLDIFFSIHGRVLHLHLQPFDLWKFWRKPQAIESYFHGTDHTKKF
ncbi:hypothetical protein LG200_08940 [Methylobacillus caricis]|uniref:hypothetical protein n=1 Tax=Methylobacillus caricis TaxID=1971611 RepID=UPI001CFF72B4|nr:hypothetical protein [Methylobacillus caricis]MCB5188126.1 hypothetical protein [Methylobacillus caricis]